MFRIRLKKEFKIIKKEADRFKTTLIRIIFLVFTLKISIKYALFVLNTDIYIFLHSDIEEETLNEVYLTKNDGLKLISEGLFITKHGYVIRPSRGNDFNINNLKQI